MTDLVREAAPDPVAALPAQLPVASRAESWNAGILKRVVALTSAPPAKDGHFYKLSWYKAASLASFDLKKEAAIWAVKPPSAASLADICSRPRVGEGIEDGTCVILVGDLMGAAVAERAGGSVAKAEEYYQRVLEADAAITAWMTDGRNCYQDFPDFPHAVRPECVWALELRALYEGISARPDALVRTLLFAETMPPKLRDPAEVPYVGLFGEVAEQLALRGQLRPMARAAELIISVYPKLNYIVVSASLIDAIDSQTYSAHGLANAVNLMAVAARMPEVYLHGPFVGDWIEHLTLALECRAAAIRAQSPATRAAATERFAEILARYEAVGEFNNTGYCLYRMAPVVGRTDARARILAVLQRKRREVAADLERKARKGIAEDREQGRKMDAILNSTATRDVEASHPRAEAAYIDAKRKSAGPWSLLAIDNEEYKAALLANLDGSKAIPQGGRDDLYDTVIRMVVWHEMHQVE